MKPLFFTIAIPLFGALCLCFLPKKHKAMASALILGATFLSSLFLLPAVAGGSELFFSRPLAGWFAFSFLADGLAVFMAAVSSFVALLISLYSLDYMRHYEEQGVFYFWTVLFVGSMMGLIFSANLMLLFCFWEMTSVCSWRLIGFYRRDKDIQAADKAFLVTFFGASIMLIGIVLIYLQTGTLETGSLKGMALGNLAAFLLLAGVISKSAQLPLQTWLPDAGVAPTPVTALLHAAVLVKIGIYVFARLFGLTFTASPEFLNAVIILSVLTIVVAAGSALVEENMKRILAYSTISQLGYILLAFSLGGIAFKVALVYILAHSLAKAGLFLCAGIIEHKTGTKDINELGGLLRSMPYTATAYLLCAFSIIGIPPFLGFWPKFMTVLLTIQSGHILAGVLAVTGALFTLFYLMRLFNKVFLGETRIKAEDDKKSAMTWVVLILGAFSLILGLFFRLPFNFVSSIVK
ncbi:MAG: NADH-quinone oxidoreductase subunit L [Candidatus Omnitrophota bacterium]|jgi:NADH:ubiquinone oxidoreductase subunit 5 (subunit L)/multisubunit Na+/H+ antiporter MnhA subunit